MPKKKGKGKKVEFLVDAAALAPFNVAVNDIVETPLGVCCTVVGVRDGALWLKWPGGIVSPATPAPQKVQNKEALATYGYNRRPNSAHVQRSIDERTKALYEARRYGKPAPKTASMRLPLGPNGVNGKPAFGVQTADGGFAKGIPAPVEGKKK